MDDLEICKRIAEIEDINFYVTKGERPLIGIIGENDFTGTPPEIIGEYNPLTNYSLCFQLMVEHEIHMNPDHQTKIWSACDGAGHFENNQYNKSPNKAICLAIIEANKGEE